ncbi:MAG: phosphatase PAP2 family protein [Bacilli bacterium]
MKKKKGLLFILCLIIFILIAVSVSQNKVINLDNIIYNFVKQFTCLPLTILFKIITFMASTSFFVIVCLIILIFIKKKKHAVLIVSNLINTVIMNQTFKVLFARPRPVVSSIIMETGYSFPSGHTMAAMSFYGFFVYLVWQTKLAKNKKIFISIILTFLIFLVGLSRVYLGVHFVSDVVGAVCLSTIYLIIYTKIISKYL